ncbi:hypothetical protein L4X63_09355 [Geomonas sp. Red32]|uniref:hypothetical protein n=1 Tax=Geomonas sp. Red32 TaxID=2912856 RepID=UPI00202CDCA6|nr:hypothetical protein [Geomonas sp. Red32]MCM0081795.1 hypothetical protein [Geomonas sp. Red32]
METGVNKWAWLWAVIAIAAISALGYLYAHPKVTTFTKIDTQYRTVPEIHTVTQVKKVYVPVKQVAVLDKTEVAKQLDMPWLTAPAPEQPIPVAAVGDQLPPSEVSSVPTNDRAQGDPADMPPVPDDPQDLQVTTTADIPECPNGAEAVTLLDTKTGQSTMIVKQKTSPWFEFENGLVAGLRYGLNTKGGQSLTPYAGVEFLRIKDFHVLGYGEVNNDLEGQFFKSIDGKVQLDIQYRRP